MQSADATIISLLGRIAFPEQELRTLITRNKRNPDAYVRGFNACDGTRPIHELAKLIGVTAGTLVPIFQEWERLGIVYEVDAGSEARGKFYHALYRLEEPS